jgi:hypothetical protein
MNLGEFQEGWMKTHDPPEEGFQKHALSASDKASFCSYAPMRFAGLSGLTPD